MLFNLEVMDPLAVDTSVLPPVLRTHFVTKDLALDKF